METLFPKHSPVGRLYEAIKQQTSAQGIPLAALEKNIDTGYVEDPFYVPARIEDPGKISAGEVLEYAYRFSEYYSLLHKHGFPVPFAMDDFDPKTDADENIRDQIRFKVRAISWTLIRDRHLVEGSDAYRLALAKEIFNWLTPLLSQFQGNKSSQLTAWQAWQQKEGECTEQSTILYYAYQEAGLSPHFFSVRNMPPRLEYYFAKSEDSFKSGHIFVGFSIQNGKRGIYADPALQQFATDFIEPIPLTPRQYAYGAHLSNQLNIAAEQDDWTKMGTLINSCEQMAPLSFFCFERSAIVYGGRPDTAGLSELVKHHDFLLKHYPSIRNDFDLTVQEIKMLKGGRLSGRFFEIIARRMDSLRNLATHYPHYAAYNYYGLYLRIQSVLEVIQFQVPHYTQQTEWYRLRDIAKQTLLEAITVNPNYMASYWELYQMAARDTSLFPEVFGFLDQIAEQNPNHATAHYLAAFLGFHAIRDKSFSLTEETIKKIERHKETLSRLEPDHAGTIWMTFVSKIFRGEYEGAIQYFEERALGRKDFPITFYADVGLLYLMAGKKDQARQMYRKVLESSPKAGPRLLYAAIREETSRFHVKSDEPEDPRRGTVSVEDGKQIEELWHFLEELVEWLVPLPEMKENVQDLYARFLFVSLFIGAEKQARRYQRKLGREPTPAVQKSLQKDLAEFVRQIQEIQNLPKTRPAEFEKFLLELKPWLDEAGKGLLGEAYLELARFYLADQRFGKARQLFQQAYQLNPQILSEAIYGQRLIQEFFTRLDKNPQDPKSLQQAWQVLELGYPYRAKFSEPLREMVRAGYALLRENYQQLGKRSQALLVAKRGRGF